MSNDTPRRETRHVSSEVPFEANGQKFNMRFTFSEKRGADFVVPHKRKEFTGLNKDTMESMYEMVDDIKIAQGEVERTMNVEFEGEVLPGKQIARTVETLITDYVMESSKEEFDESIRRVDVVMDRLKKWAKDLGGAGLEFQQAVHTGQSSSVHAAHARAKTQKRFSEELSASGTSTASQPGAAAPAAS